MAQDQTKKEALFNEVKGSLFEYLVAQKLAQASQEELSFHKSLDQNYLNVLSQQDRMVRQFYPEMLKFLNGVSQKTAESISLYFPDNLKAPKLMGKFMNSSLKNEINEADLILTTATGTRPVSLKLNKKNAFVNTKSGGIKSFFSLYFPFLSTDLQQSFNELVDLEFARMGAELHALHDMDYPGDFSLWTQAGLSELPGELGPQERDVLKAYYARLSKAMHSILTNAKRLDNFQFGQGLAPLMGFGNPEILQVVCFHDFKSGSDPQINIHPFSEIKELLDEAKIIPVKGTSSVEIEVGHWNLQIRVKPMNKFTTTAIKINCSVKVRPPSDV